MSIDRGVWFAPEGLDASQLAAFGRRVEELGYSTLWLGETFGRDPFAQCAHLGAVTTALRLASGIANVYHRHPGVMRQGANTVAEQTGGRFVLGLGVSSPQIVSRARGIEYARPRTFISEYLDRMESALYLSVEPPEPVPVVLAALGPRMLELAAERTSGAHPYNVTPEHTALARSVMGPEAGLYVEQKVMLTTDADQARATAARVLKFYQRAPGYRRNWNRLGFTDDDIDSLSGRFVDAMVAWGDADTIEARLQEHADAGATHVCVQPLHPEHGIGAIDDEALVALAP
ncbi:MAG: TIGR03620 family F420-dependent LLM class oxidoreductase [Acidimicrobiales bacterium]